MRNNLLTNIGRVTLLTAAVSVALPLAAANAADAPEATNSGTRVTSTSKAPTVGAAVKKTVTRSVNKTGYGGRVKGTVGWHDPARWRATWNLKVTDPTADGWCVRAKVILDKPNAFDKEISSRRVCHPTDGKKAATVKGKDAHDLRGIKVQMCRVNIYGQKQRCKEVQYLKNYFY